MNNIHVDSCPPAGVGELVVPIYWQAVWQMENFILSKATEVLGTELNKAATTVYCVPKNQDPLVKEYLTSLDL